MKPERQKEYNDIFVNASTDGKRKKGGSLGAVFKLIQELTEFEVKIQECAESQEMTENRSKIESFVGSMDEMYDTLFNMAKGGVQSIRSDREQGQMMNGGEVEGDDEGVIETEEINEMQTEDVSRPPLMMNVPQIPSM